MKGNIRKKTTHCGKRGTKERYREVDIYQAYDIPNKGRKRKANSSRPVQQILNNKNARRYFNQLATSNFGDNDLHVSLTYSDKFKPATQEEAEKEAANFIRRLKTKRKAKGLPPLKYLLVTEHGGKNGRVHHHLLINGGLDRDTIEACWRRRKKKGEAEGEKIGYANADRIQPDENGSIEALANYLMKDPKGHKRWKQSLNLVKPWESISDSSISKKTLQQIITAPEDSEQVKAIIEKLNPGYYMKSLKKTFVEEVGQWYITAKLYRMHNPD